MNQSETEVKKILENRGCSVYKTGFPDFLVKHKSGAICFIEVKHGSDKVRTHQKEVHDVLKNAKIPVHVWKHPDDNKKTFKFIEHDSNLVNYNFIREWALQVHETLQAALEIQNALHHLFYEKDAEIHRLIGGYNTSAIFDWEKIYQSFIKIFSEDGVLLYEQLKNLASCRNYIVKERELDG